MSTTALLVLWSLLIGVAGGRPAGSGGPWRWPMLALIGATLALSSLWRALAWSLWKGETPPLAGPEAAYLCVWILILLPILQCRLDLRALGETLLSGLIAAAAFGLALDITTLVLAALATAGLAEPWAGMPGAAILAILSLAGLAARLILQPACVPWDYPAWFAAWLLMRQAAA